MLVFIKSIVQNNNAVKCWCLLISSQKKRQIRTQGRKANTTTKPYHNSSICKTLFIFFAGLSFRFFNQKKGKQIQFGSLYTFIFYHLSALTCNNQLLIINNFHSTVYHFTFSYTLWFKSSIQFETDHAFLRDWVQQRRYRH